MTMMMMMAAMMMMAMNLTCGKIKWIGAALGFTPPGMMGSRECS
jgi:hypothetical protein